ncbi:RNA-directed DNA polymerase, eukaryota, reverse transcriptase zinc-binding domain protein [Tanacetum coccineum]
MCDYKNRKSVMVSKRIERYGRKNREERNYRIVWKTDRVKGSKRIERNDESKTERELWEKNRQSDIGSKRIERYGRKTKKRGMNKKQKESWNIRGLCSQSDKQKEVKKLIMEEGLQFCAVLETHVKYKNIKKVCNLVFGNWEYVTNGEDNNKGCRIMVGWNSNVIRAWLMMETMDKQSKFFCIMIYASNSRMERRKLWADLERQKIITSGNPWIIMGDFNIAFKVAEHSNWGYPTSEMTEFQECIDKIEIVQKMKVLKRKLKKLSWENGNVFERVENLRIKVKECQAKVDKFPHDENIKEESWSVLKEYQQANEEEYSLLCQKAKVEWLKDGDRNTAYFHKTIKERTHRGIIMSIRNEERIRFVNEDVANQIVKHFEDFLGKRRDV